MKKHTVLAMVMALTLVGTSSIPAKAAGGNCYNGSAQCGNRIIVNGQVLNQSDLQSVLNDVCGQLQNGNAGNCTKIVIPNCNQNNANLGNCLPGNNVGNSTECTPNTGNNCKPEASKPSGSTSCNPGTSKPSGSTNCNPSTSQPSTSQPSTSQPSTSQSSTNQPSTSVTEKNTSTKEPENKKPEKSTEAPKADSENLSYAEQVVKLVNEERAKVGLHALTIDTSVTAAANIRAKEIVTSFSHTRPDGRKFSTVLTDNGIRYTGAGENIAWGQRSPEEVVSAWMNSEGHRANILNAKYTKIGVGYLNSSGRNYWVQLFTY